MPQPCGIAFAAEYDGQDIFEAYKDLEPGLGQYAIVKVWETELMIDLGITDEVAYGLIPLVTRARMIAARKLPQLIRAMDDYRMYQRLRKQGQQRASN